MTDKESDISLSVARVSIRCTHAADYPNPTPFAIPECKLLIVQIFFTSLALCPSGCPSSVARDPFFSALGTAPRLSVPTQSSARKASPPRSGLLLARSILTVVALQCEFHHRT